MTLRKGMIFLTGYQSNIKLSSFFFADTLELRPSGSAIFWSLTMLTSQKSGDTRSVPHEQPNLATLYSQLDPLYLLKLLLCSVWERCCFWTRTVIKGVLMWRHAAQQCETQKVVATKLNFYKHTLHEYKGNCEGWTQWIPQWAVVSVGTWKWWRQSRL